MQKTVSLWVDTLDAYLQNMPGGYGLAKCGGYEYLNDAQIIKWNSMFFAAGGTSFDMPGHFLAANEMIRIHSEDFPAYDESDYIARHIDDMQWEAIDSVQKVFRDIGPTPKVVATTSPFVDIDGEHDGFICYAPIVPVVMDVVREISNSADWTSMRTAHRKIRLVVADSTINHFNVKLCRSDLAVARMLASVISDKYGVSCLAGSIHKDLKTKQFAIKADIDGIEPDCFVVPAMDHWANVLFAEERRWHDVAIKMNMILGYEVGSAHLVFMRDSDVVSKMLEDKTFFEVVR